MRTRCLVRCLMMGRKPNIHKEMKSRVNTLPLLFRRDERRIDAKNMALILVGEKTLLRQFSAYFFFTVTGSLSLPLSVCSISM